MCKLEREELRVSERSRGVNMGEDWATGSAVSYGRLTNEDLNTYVHHRCKVPL